MNYTFLSYSEVERQASALGANLARIMQPCSGPAFVGIFGAISVPWLVSDFACILQGIPSVLIQRSTSASQLRLIVDDTQLRVLICSTHFRRVLVDANIEGNLTIIWIEDDEDAYMSHPSSDMPTCVEQHTWESMTSEAEPNSSQPAPKKVLPGDIVKLLPTSGTTGSRPKLVVVTDGMLRPRHHARSTHVVSSTGPTVAYAYELLRQSHDLILNGGRIGVASSSLTRLLEDIQLLRPTVVAASPAIWCSVMRDWEEEVASVEKKASNEAEAERALCSNRVLNAWRNRRILGNRIQVLVSTGSPLPHRVGRWLFRAVGRPIVNGYGTTETGGLISNGLVKMDEGVDIRLVDVPSLGYLTSDEPFP